MGVEARVDAVVGLAADALGVGRLAASARLLERAEELMVRAEAPPARLAIRLAWVSAELAMAGGRGEDAVTHARRGVEIAEAALPDLRRHRVKSDVVLAAALCCVGSVDSSREVADAALSDTQTYGLVPLRWALACLLADINSATLTSQQVSAIRDDCAGVITRRGGRWTRR
jgi:ATP/maltotriose-dependent transcriptional regulator MalT